MLSRLFSKADFFLIIPAFLIVFLSFFVLSSFRPELSRSQGVFMLVGVGIFFFFRFIHTTDLRAFAKWFYFVILLLLFALFFIGEVSRGSNRWIPIFGDLSIQPSEFAKPAFILIIATLFSTSARLHTKLFISSCVYLAFYFYLVFVQPDLGTALTFIVVWLTALLLSGIPKKRLLISLIVVCLVGIVAGPLGWNVLHDYQRARILTFIDPQRDPLGRGYNAIQSIITVGSGGVFGKGFGQGTQSHNNFLPEQYTDFAFATFAEEFGFLGVSALLVLYSIIIFRLFYIAGSSKSRFTIILSLCTAMLIFSQLFINMGMNMGVMPITGITLPFFSYGGSSLLSFFLCLAFVHSAVSEERY